MNMDGWYTLEVTLEENLGKHPAFPEDVWRITFRCPYCHNQAQATFSENFLRIFICSSSCLQYSCKCQAWTGFNPISIPETFVAGATIIIETRPPVQSP